MSSLTPSELGRKLPLSAEHEAQMKRTSERESNARSYSRKYPFSIKKGEGCYFFDVDGNKYLDCLANAGTLALGHNHPVLVEAAKKFFEESRPMQTLDMTTETKDEFVSTLFSILPEELRENGKVQFCGPSGSDCIEAAIKLCKTATGNRSVLCFSGGYHGHGHGSLSLTGNLTAKKKIPGLMSNVFVLPYPYPYRCPFGIGGEEGTKTILRYIERLLDDPESGIVAPACVILEAVQGEGGVIPAPVEFLKGLRKITAERGIPLILDEIQAGFCRTGKMFAFQWADIVPDVVTLSKAIGGGMPMALVVYNKKLDKWEPGAHAGTFRGNQIALALGKATIDYLVENDVDKAVLDKGEHLLSGLNALKAKYSVIGDIRGKGLMIGVELVDTSKPADHLGSYPANGDLAVRTQAACFARGLILEKGGRFSATLRFLPALTITKEELDVALSILESALEECVAK